MELLSLNEVGSSGIEMDPKRASHLVELSSDLISRSARGEVSETVHDLQAEGIIHISSILISSVVGFKNVRFHGCLSRFEPQWNCGQLLAPLPVLRCAST